MVALLDHTKMSPTARVGEIRVIEILSCGVAVVLEVRRSELREFRVVYSWVIRRGVSITDDRRVVARRGGIGLIQHPKGPREIVGQRQLGDRPRVRIASIPSNDGTWPRVGVGKKMLRH
jgi:hypothetical protein